MIEVRNLSKSFDGKQVLKDVNFTMEAGKTNLIIGSSGSGKTVLMKCMIGLFKPEEGQILYNGVDMASSDIEAKKEIRKQIGMLFQGSALFDSKTVEENVRFPLDMFTNHSLKQKKERVEEVLARVNLVDANKKFPSEISGGMQKRVALARAIVLNPKFLFCDEPNSGLDPKTAIIIDQLIKEVTEEYNIVTVINTHDMNTVMESGDHIVYMHKGSKRWEGSNNDIFYSEDELLNDFIFASSIFREAKAIRLKELQNVK